MISIHMLKICGNSICKQFSQYSDLRLKMGNSHPNGRKANIVPIHKKVSLLAICGKILLALNLLTFNQQQLI